MDLFLHSMRGADFANAEATRDKRGGNARTAVDVERLRMSNRQHMFLLEDKNYMEAGKRVK